MKKIHVWCIVMTVLFLVLGLAKATAASPQVKAKKDPDMSGPLQGLSSPSNQLGNPS